METIVSGARPTGRLHLGHLHGALKNWIRLQDNYRCFFFVADWHALTTDYSSPQGIRENTIEMVIDWLSIGLDQGPDDAAGTAGHDQYGNCCRVYCVGDAVTDF